MTEEAKITVDHDSQIQAEKVPEKNKTASILSTDESPYWSTAKSLDISRKSFNQQYVARGGFYRRLLINLRDFISLERVNFFMTFLRMKIVVQREFHSMLSRPKMLLGSFVLIIAIACLYGILMHSDDAGLSAAAITSFFGFGAVLIMLTMLQLAFYLFNNQKVI
jgi:hypothetical protein